MGHAIKSISVSLEFQALAQKHNISWSEAARVGMGVILAEKGIDDYDTSLNIFRKMQVLRKQLEETSQKYYVLKEKYEGKDDVINNVNKNEEEVFNNVIRGTVE